MSEIDQNINSYDYRDVSNANFGKLITDLDVDSYKTKLVNRAKVPYPIRSLFFPETKCNSIWVLIINGIHIVDEAEIAKSMLFWKEFSSGKEAEVKCITPTQPEFNYFLTEYSLSDFPTLLISDNYEIKKRYILIKYSFLLELTKKGELDKFLNKIHALLLQGGGLDSIKKFIWGQDGKKFFGRFYKELKSLISFKGTANID